MADRFNKFVQGHQEVGRRLPGTHVTDAYSARDIVTAQELAATQCPVFKELLLYFFHGRVSYRVHPDEPPSALKSYAPVCFVVAPDATKQAKRIFPFDTGAFAGGYYANSMHHKMKYTDFELEPYDETPQRLVKAFFGTNKDYITNSPCLKTAQDPIDFEVESFIALINDPTKNIRDDRASAIEIQIDRNVPLRGAVLAVVMPSDLEKSTLVSDLNVIGATPLFYSVVNRMKPSEYVGSLTSTLHEFLRRERFL